MQCATLAVLLSLCAVQSGGNYVTHNPTTIQPTPRGAPCRDRRAQPFSSQSIWNTPIGSDAQFVPANMFTNFTRERACELRKNLPSRRTLCPGAKGGITPEDCIDKGCCFDNSTTDPRIPWCFERADGGNYPGQFHNDEDYMIFASADDPMTPWLSQGDWGPDDKCKQHGPLATHIPFPANFSTGEKEGNNAMGLLLPDNVTLIQAQPLYRCGAGAPVLAQYQQGCPVPFPWVTKITDDGAWGAHGGSGLSAVGGTIRSGELSRNAPPIPHALKIEGFAHDQYYGGIQGEDWSYYTWPALGHDGYAKDPQGLFYNGSSPHVKPGALLAIPGDVAGGLQLRTIPGQKLRDALRDYGGYIVDDTANPSGALCMEGIVSEQLKAEYNVTFGSYATGVAEPGMPIYEDLKVLFQALHAVVNNGPGSVGGGGTPRRPLAPPLCDV